MSELLVIAGLFLVALGFALSGTASRVCHVLAAVVFGVALVGHVVDII